MPRIESNADAEKSNPGPPNGQRHRVQLEIRNQLITKGLIMPLPKNAKNDQYQRLERRRQVADLYLNGATQWEIAGRLQCSQGTVCNDLAAIREQWLGSSLRDFDAKKAEELARLDAVERAAWQVWERSFEDARTSYQRTEEALQSPPKATKGRSEAKEDQARLVVVRRIVAETRKGQAGDPRFLERVGWCIECSLKVIGALKAEKDVQVVTGFPWDAIAGIGAGPVGDRVEARLAEALEVAGEPALPVNRRGSSSLRATGTDTMSEPERTEAEFARPDFTIVCGRPRTLTFELSPRREVRGD